MLHLPPVVKNPKKLASMATITFIFRGTLMAWCLLSVQSSFTTPTQPALPPSNPCIPSERDALIQFKEGLTDPYNYLSSWQGKDCCAWPGIECSKRNGHVVTIWLHGAELGGEVNPSLLVLRHLKYLNLGWNDFGGASIPDFIGNFKNLRYLDLSLSNFSGSIPPRLGNLSKLIHLDLNTAGDYPAIYSTDLKWLTRLTMLQYLDLGVINLSSIVDWAHSINMLPSLVQLGLSGCGIKNIVPPPVHMNLTSLEVVFLNGNPFNSPVGIKHFFWPFWDLPSLERIYLNDCGLQGSLPEVVGNLTSLGVLDLNMNDLTGVPITLKRLHALESLHLAQNNFNGDIQDLLDRLPGNSLHILELHTNNLTGSLPANTGHLRDLHTLYLSDNKLSGNIPHWIGEHTNLTRLELDSNNLDGSITQSHLTKLARLKFLGLSYNSLTMVVDQQWNPPFKLWVANLRNCRLGPKFPEWLKSQDGMYILDISNTSIADSIPDWFWSTFSKTDSLIISRNDIKGTLPVMFKTMSATAVDFSDNLLEGGLQNLPENLTYLDLSRNNISGSLPLDFEAPMLNSLILFENSLSGAIPNSFCQLNNLQFVDLSANLLQGPFPDCLESSEVGNKSYQSLPVISNIFMLNLNGNNLSGAFPLFLKKCKNLVFLDFAFNQFSGSLPSWVGEKLLSLAFLSLRSNKFSGEIPHQFSKMKELQYLDLACNNFSGIIPGSLVHLKAMSHMPANNNSLSNVVYYGWALWSSHYISWIFSVTEKFISYMIMNGADLFDISQELDNGYGPDFSYINMLYNNSLSVVIKGQQLEFTTGVRFMVNFDLSCNNLIGNIPEEISRLTALKTLNLSWNYLSGQIPTDIGDLQSLESLDLSHNGLSGQIPISMSSIASLSHLNLSYNNLSGHIPSGNQLQVLDNQASIYIGNPLLCGPPLSKNCSETNTSAREEKSDAFFLYLGMGIGWVVGIWVAYFSLLLNQRWRVAWLLFSDHLYDYVYVKVALAWASLTRAAVRS